MFGYADFFKTLEGFPTPNVFDPELDEFNRIVYVWDILKRIQSGFVSKVVKPGIHGLIDEGAFVRGDNIYIGHDSRVMAGAMILGPAIIGNNVEIRHGAFIRGHVIIGDNSVIGHATEVGRSIFLPGAKAPHFNYVGDSILGTNANLGAGTKLSNLKNDGSGISVKAAGTKYDTGLRKFGAILGDGCLLGCNSVSNPGTVMAPNGRVYPNTTISGYFPPGAIVKNRQTIEIDRLK